MPHTPGSLPDFVNWPSFPFEGQLRIKQLEKPVEVEPPRPGEDVTDCEACRAPDDAYIWVSERWRVRSLDVPSGLPMVLVLESRSHLDLGDLSNLLAAELGVMIVRLERAIRSLDGVGRVHVNRWGDGAAHLHLWFLARPYGRLQLRGSFLSLWDDILPPVPEPVWRENLALVAAWLAEFGGTALAEPPHIDWQSPASLSGVQAVGRVEELLRDHPAAAAAGAAGATPEPATADREAPGTDDEPIAPAPDSGAPGSIGAAGGSPGGGAPLRTGAPDGDRPASAAGSAT
ncbi:MAG TPA: hypothetical protein VNV66_04715 [Pilimelia sp.]|nr:hypothetical protein [Pilimelia sp.]